MSEEIGEASQEIVTPATQEVPQGDQPNTPEQAPEQDTQADTAEQPEEHRVPKGVQKRIDRLTRERYRLQGELEAMRRQAQPEAKPTQAAEGAPTPEQFSSYEGYLEAKAEWKAEQKVAEVLGRQAETTKRQSAQAEQATLQRAWESKVDAALEVYDDFEEVALAHDVPISVTMMEAILRTDKAADVAYYLGKNRAEAKKIERMDPFSQAVAIGRIEATLARPAPKKATAAPPPISPVGARTSVSKDPDRMSTNEWLAWRREQLAAKGKR